MRTWKLLQIRPGLNLLLPLTRSQRTGPGIIILIPHGTPSVKFEKGVPSLSLKWAEEGYTVAEIQASCFEDRSASPLKEAINALDQCAERSSVDKVGIVARLLGFHIHRKLD